MKKKDVVIIDPWGNGEAAYLHGLLGNLSKKANIHLMTSGGYKKRENIKLNKIFFLLSDLMPEGNLRRIVRGIEYIIAYFYIIIYIYIKKCSIVHIQWLLLYDLDRYFIEILSKHCTVIYTAHNAMPHIDNDNKVLGQIYNRVDKIIVHGNHIKQEIENIFNIDNKKIEIIPHGIYVNAVCDYMETGEVCNLKKHINKYDRVWLLEGNIFYNKGFDRVVKIWLENFKQKNELLVVAGKINKNYVELTNLLPYMVLENDILFIPKFIEENTMTFLMEACDVFLLPYRHASMSGVVFSAALHKKTLIATKVGAIPEYIDNVEGAFLCENEDNDILGKMSDVDKLSKEELSVLGNEFYKYIYKKYNWDKIADQTISLYDN